MMVVAASGKEGCSVAHPLGYREAENLSIERNGSFQIGHLEVNMADASFGRDGIHLDILKQKKPLRSAESVNVIVRIRTERSDSWWLTS